MIDRRLRDEDKPMLQYFEKMQHVYITIRRIAFDNNLTIEEAQKICNRLFIAGKIETCNGLYDVDLNNTAIKLKMFEIYRIKAVDSPSYDYYY